MQKQWHDAGERYDEMLTANPAAFDGFDTCADVNIREKAGFKLEQKYWLLRISEFTKLFKYVPKALGMKISVFKDEQGIKDLKGVVVKPSPHLPLHKYRVITFYSMTEWEIAENICSGSKRLRDTQPQETYNAISSKKSKSHSLDCYVIEGYPQTLTNKNCVHRTLTTLIRRYGRIRFQSWAPWEAI